MMKYISLSGIIITLLFLTACEGIKLSSADDDEHTTTLFISNSKVECTSLKLGLCLQIKTKDDSIWTQYAADIIDFSYEWGYDYEIKVSYKDLDPKPEDAPAREYTFIETTSKTKAPSSILFSLNISRTKTTDIITKKLINNDTIYRVYDEVDIKCDPVVECETIEDNIAQDNAIKLILSHNENSGNPLNISSIACSSARESFQMDCP